MQRTAGHNRQGHDAKHQRNPRYGPSLTLELAAALAAARLWEAASQMLIYRCASCTGTFDEATVEGVLKRAAANAHGSAITPELELLAASSSEPTSVLGHHPPGTEFRGRSALPVFT